MRVAQYAVELLRRLQRLSRIDFNTSTQRLQLLVGNPVTESQVELFKVQWRMPHIVLNEINKLSMLRALKSGRYLSMRFCLWDLYECTLLQNTTKHSWAVKTATQLEKPRYIIRLYVCSADRSKEYMS